VTERRGFLRAAVVGLIAGPLAARAQSPAPRTYRIGFLGSSAPPPELLATVRGGLRERGYVEGSNLALEVR